MTRLSKDGRKTSHNWRIIGCEVKSLAMTTTKRFIVIKGTKDGLVFYLDDTCSLEELFGELEEKIEYNHQQFLSGPHIPVTLKLGKRYLTEEQRKHITEILGKRGNLLIKSIDSDVITRQEALIDKLSSQVRVVTRTIRSGQVLEHTGDLLLLGDLNPGGFISCTGNIYIFGSLRGSAHAGCGGNDECIIAAFEMFPIQLRIANIISRPPDEWMDTVTEMEFAYIMEGRMAIDKINQLYKIRPDLGQFTW